MRIINIIILYYACLNDSHSLYGKTVLEKQYLIILIPNLLYRFRVINVYIIVFTFPWCNFVYKVLKVMYLYNLTYCRVETVLYRYLI